MKLSVKEITIFSFLAAIMYVSKIIMEFLPNIHLIGVFVISITVVYRKKALYPIYIFVMITGLFSAFSTWWIPYLYIWTILWALVMLLPQNINSYFKPLVYMILCSLHGLFYGILYAPVNMIIFNMSFKGIIAWIAAGFFWDIMHAVGNFICGALICPIIKAIKLGEKYTSR